MKREGHLIKTVASLFVETASRYHDRTFIHTFIDGREVRLSYGDAARRLAGMCGELKALGFVAGDRMVCYFDEREMESVLMLLACAHIGVVPTFLSKLVYSKAYAQRIASHVNAKLILENPEHLMMMRWADAGTSLAALETEANKRKPDDLYALVLTSGSTGEPKLVAKPALATGDFEGACYFRAQEQQRILLLAPMAHGQGIMFVGVALLIGAELAIPTENDVRANLEEIRHLDPTYLRLTPRVLRSLHKQQKPGDARLFGPSACFLHTGAAVADFNLLRLVWDQGIGIWQRYGTTEANTVTIGEHNLKRMQDGYVGPLAHDVSVKIHDGEILVKSPRQMLGYYRADGTIDPDSFTPDGFVRTGDLGEIVNGNLRLLGRKHDAFNTMDGLNVYPARTEAIIEGLAGVEQAILIGDQKPYIVALITVLPNGNPNTIEEGIAEINKGLESNQQVKRFKLLASPFESDIYGATGAGSKLKRHRKLAESRYSRELEALYDGQCVDRQS